MIKPNDKLSEATAGYLFDCAHLEARQRPKGAAAGGMRS